MAPSLVLPTAHPQAPCLVSPPAPSGSVLPRTGSCPRGTPHRRRTGAKRTRRSRTRPKHALGPAPPSCGPCNPRAVRMPAVGATGSALERGVSGGRPREGAPGVRGRRWVVQGVNSGTSAWMVVMWGCWSRCPCSARRGPPRTSPEGKGAADGPGRHDRQQDRRPRR